MKISKIALTALLFWVVTIAVFGWFFVHGRTTMGTDGRTAILLQASERELILSEMRGMLAATQGVLEGANQGNMQRVTQAASAAGIRAAGDANPALMAKLPIELKTLGMSVHRDMDEMAEAAARGTPAPKILNMLSDTLAKCVACHSTWQLKAEN